jgi:desulfoferrodoxin (superoxide reductase-like protein)
MTDYSSSSPETISEASLFVYVGLQVPHPIATEHFIVGKETCGGAFKA